MAVPRVEFDAPFLEAGALFFNRIAPLPAFQGLPSAEYELFRLASPRTAEELRDRILDLFRAKFLLVLALVDGVPIGTGATSIKVDALLVVPLYAVRPAELDIGLSPGQSQAQLLEVLPAYLVKRQILDPWLNRQGLARRGRVVENVGDQREAFWNIACWRCR